MKTQLLKNIIFLVFFFIFEKITNMQVEKNKNELNVELDSKLNDLFSYYKNLLQNTGGEDKLKVMKSFESNANSLMNGKLNQPLFIQSTMKQLSDAQTTDTNFMYQPFVWTQFSTKNEGPSERRGHSSVLADTYMIIFGGCYMDSKCYNDVYFLELRTHQWTKISTTGKIPSARQGHTAILYGSVMWVYGGSSSEGEWKQHSFVGAKKTGRAGHGAVIDNNSRLIIFGGYADTGYLNDLFVINLVLERFENPLTTGTPPTPRENFAMKFINNRIYIFGGFQEGGTLNDTFSIDLLTWTWIKINTQGPTPPPRQGMASARVGKKIYVTGGCDYRVQQCYTDTYILDTDSLWWTKVENNKSDLVGRESFTLNFFRGHLYSFGGCEMYKQCFKDVYVMNINDLCPDKCSGKGECKENIGCVCNQGWIAHDCSRQVKCKDDCSGNGECHNNAKCGCYPGWSGIVCNTLIPCPRNCTASANGVCQLDSSCKCKPGFSGKDCSEYTIVGNETVHVADPFKVLASMQAQKVENELKTMNVSSVIPCPNNCSQHGTCNTTKGLCTCEANFSGDDCSIKLVNTTAAKRVKEPEEEEPETDEGNSTEKQKLELLNAIKIGPNNEIYYRTYDCKSNCTKKGACLNSTCFCDQGFTSDDCSQTYKQYLEQGYKFSDMLKFILIAFGASAVATLIVLFYKSNQKISGDHLDIDN